MSEEHPEMSYEVHRQVPHGKVCDGRWVPPDYTDAPYRPKSKWTKAEIVRMAKLNGAPKRAVKIMQSMGLAQLWEAVMVSVGWEKRGRDYNWRWTEFYGLDADAVSKLGETEEKERFAALAAELGRLVEDERGFDLAVRGRTYHFIPGDGGWVVTAKNLEMSSRHLFLQFAPGDAFIRIESDPCQAKFSVVVPMRDGDGTTVREAPA